MTDLSSLTRGIRTGIDQDPAHGAVVPPLYLTSTFSFEALGMPRTYDYTRSGNPTRAALAQALTTFEGGAGGVVTATGTAAMSLILTALVRVGESVVVPHDCYGGSWRLFESLAERGHLAPLTVDFADRDQLTAALRARPRLVWIETPSNPLLRITDIAETARLAHESGALVAVDNTFLSPLLQKPFELGADIVLHSTTKYLNGHSDVVGGAVIAKTPEVAETLDWWANVLGVTGAPFDSYMTLRGLRTLHARLRVNQENTHAIVSAIAGHPAVARVHFPGLADHPDHELAIRQQSGFGAMFSIELHGGRRAVEAFVSELRCFSLAESLGGVESLVAHPVTMTHAAMPPEAQQAAGITEGLLRFSVGIEEADDLVADVLEGLERALIAAEKSV